MSLFAELKRRNVFRVAIAYLALAWLLIEVAGTLFPGFGIPEWAFRFVVIVLALGFVPTLVFSWAYEITAEGLRREKEIIREDSITHLTAKRLDKLTIGLIVVALAFITVDRLWLGSRLINAPATSADMVTKDVAGSEFESDIPPRSIAVLPFANRSADPDDAYFVDGIHDDLLTHISQIGSIKTISRTSVMKYRDTTQSIREIARELGVATVLEGGVQRAGDQVRINVQLIDARTDDHLWSHIYDRQMTVASVFAIQSEIAESIAQALRATLSPEARQRIDRVPTENLAALEAYFLGRQSMATRTLADLARAIEHFEAASTQDPEFALAFAGLADAYLLHSGYGGMPIEEAFEKNRAATERALQLDPNLGEAYASEAKRRHWEGDWEGAEAAFRKALLLSPNYAPAYQWYAEMLREIDGRIGAALEIGHRAVELDPKSAIIVNDYGEVLETAGRLEEALARYRQAVEIEPRFAAGYGQIGHLQAVRLGRLDEALIAFFEKLSVEEYWTTCNIIGLIYLELGDLQQAEAWIEPTLAIAPESVIPSLPMAVHTYRGEDDAALALARKDIELDPGSLPSLRLVRDHEIRNGDLAAARELFEQGYPDLFDKKTLNIGRHNRAAAIDLAYVLLQTGETAAAERLLDESRKVIASGGPYRSWEGFGILEARIDALRGDKENAIAALQRTVDRGWRWSAWYFLEHDPILAPLRDEAGFQRIKAGIQADMAEQLARVREWEATGELSLRP